MKHYSRWQRHGDPMLTKRASPTSRDATEKVCPRCGKSKLVKYFALRTNGARKGYCRECEKTYMDEYFATPKGRAKKRKAAMEYQRRNRNARLLKMYGIDLAGYDALAASQGHRCAICDTDDPGAGNDYWCIDHCHSTGKVRGLLCGQCNFALGQFKDDPDIVRAALRYLTP